jgi:hypothetical protein
MRPDFSTKEVKGFFSKKTGKIKYLKEKVMAIVVVLLFIGLVFMFVSPKPKAKSHRVSTTSLIDDVLSFLSINSEEVVGLVDNDHDGFDKSKDCDDNNPKVNPSAREKCNDQTDSNCDGNLDEGCAGLPNAESITYYYDGDVDGYGSSSTKESSVALSGPYVKKGGDCDDSNGSVYPGAKEDCTDRLDNNCDGEVNEGCVVPPSAFRVNGSNVSYINMIMGSGMIPEWMQIAHNLIINNYE